MPYCSIILKFIIMENWAILSSLNSELLNFLGSLKVIKQSMKISLNLLWFAKDGLSKFILCYLASSIAAYSLCFYSCRIPSTCTGDTLGLPKIRKIHKFVKCSQNRGIYFRYKVFESLIFILKFSCFLCCWIASINVNPFFNIFLKTVCGFWLFPAKEVWQSSIFYKERAHLDIYREKARPE